MTTTQRGKIRSRTYATTINDYSGVRYGRITPTDIDGFIDFGNVAFVVIEMKYSGADLPTGQRIAIERLVDALHSTGRPTVGFVAEHNGGSEVDTALCSVIKYRFQYQWWVVEDGSNLKQMIDRFLRKFATQYLGNKKQEHSLF